MLHTINIIRRNANTSLLEALPKNLSPLIRRIFAQRQINSPDEISFALKNLLPNTQLNGIENASEILSEAIINNKSILIVGDYDADGATATALSFLVLKEMGGNVQYYSTNRFDEGYGMSKPLVAKLHKKFDFDLILTVDLGISANEGVQHAKELGYQVVITDHHLPPSVLPNADSIVNPNLPQCNFPSKHLAGVGVAFYTLSGLRNALEKKGWFTTSKHNKPNLAKYLDLVAIGTIADVMQLDKNNKILVARGLRLIQEKQCRLGISVLLEKYGNINTPDTQDLSYQLIPRLNSAGRMRCMSEGVEWLLTNNLKEADELSQKLNAYNTQRKLIESKIQAEAEYIINNEQMPDDFAKIAYSAKWHPGVIGIVAGKVKQQYNRPCFIFCEEIDNTIKGSGRSIEGINLNTMLEKLNQKHPKLIINYGGHSMAAGVTIAKKDLPVFKQHLNQYLNTLIKKLGSLKHTVETDGLLQSKDFCLNTVRQLRHIPWGNAFPSPVFDGYFQILWHQKRGKHSLFAVKIDEKRHLECIAFNQQLPSEHKIGDEIHLVYELKEKNYAGKSSLQLLIKHIRLKN